MNNKLISADVFFNSFHNRECPLGLSLTWKKKLEKGVIRQMLGVDNMNKKETNIALLSTIPDDAQQQIFLYLTENFCTENPFKPLTADEILAELAESRACYERGEYEDFDEALDEISKKYGL